MKGSKKERRLQRHLRNKQKEVDHKKEAWDRGAFIEENHNNGPYSEDYTDKLANRLVDRLIQARNLAISCDVSNEFLIKADSDRNKMFVMYFWKYRKISQDLILHWSPYLERDNRYNTIKNLLETYWDNPDKLICVLEN